MLTDEKLREIRARWAVVAGFYEATEFDPDRELVVRWSANAATDVPLLLDEIERLQNLLLNSLPYLDDHQDEGPTGEGWKSDALRGLIAQIEAQLPGTPESVGKFIENP